MKFYISWYPDPPDPKYWDWFEIDGLMISLGNLRGRQLTKAINLGIHRFIGFKGSIFLDSGAFQSDGKKKTATEILELQNWLRPDLVSHLDKPFLHLESIDINRRWQMLRDTIENAKIARKWEKSNNNIRVVYVIQGWNRESLRICADKMAKLNCDYYGIGSLFRQSSNEIKTRIKIVREKVGNEPKLHLFGVNPLKYLEENPREDAFYIESLDCSSSIRAGIVKEFLDPVKLYRIHIDEATTDCSCPICRKYPTSISLVGLMGKFQMHNKIRAIHNAYWFTKVVREA